MPNGFCRKFTYAMKEAEVGIKLFFKNFSVQNSLHHVITILFPIEYYSKISMGKCQFLLSLGAQNRTMTMCLATFWVPTTLLSIESLVSLQRVSLHQLVYLS